ncbi:hypothetical protein OB13_18940 [Pontibacter sp. HJ8]
MELYQQQAPFLRRGGVGVVGPGELLLYLDQLAVPAAIEFLPVLEWGVGALNKDKGSLTR